MPDQQPSWPIGVPQPPDKWSWEHFWEAWLSTMVRSVDIGWLNSLIENGIPHVVAAFVATMLSTRATTARVMGRAIAEVETEADPILLGMAAAGLSDYFETPISAGQLMGPGNRSHRQGLVDQLSGLVLSQLFGTFDAGGTITPAAGAKNAERVIGFNLSTALEGWLEGLLGPGFLHDWIPTYADLDDVISENLGLGRLTRRVLTPLMNALIVTPYTQHLNTTFRPSIYSESQAVRAMNRGQLTEPEYYDLMARLGWDREKAGELRVILGPVASLDQIRGFLELGLVDSAGAKTLISAQGYDPVTAGLLLQNIRQDRIRTLRTEAVSVARAMFAARELTEGELDDTLSAAGLTALERDAVKVVAGLQRSRPTSVPRGTMEDAFELDLVSSAELTGYYEHEGYSARSREILLGLVLKKKAAALAAKAQRDSAAAAKLHRPLSQSAAMELHRRGLITSAALGPLLQVLGFQGDPLQQLVALAEQRRRDYLLALQRAAAAAAPDLPPRSAVENSYVRGLVGIDLLQGYYVAAGYRPDAIALLLQLASARRADYLGSIAAAEARATEAEKREAERAAREAAAEERRKAAEEKRENRPLPQAQAVELYRRGLIPRGQLEDLLRAIGLQGVPAQLALNLADQRRKDYVAAQAKAAAAAGPAPAPRSAEEEAFIRHVIELDTLHAYYVAQGYDVGAAALLEELAAQQRDEYDARQAAAAAAPATPAARDRP
jgi:hypothetical protein